MAPSWRSGGFSVSGSQAAPLNDGADARTAVSAPEERGARSRQLGRSFTGRPLGERAFKPGGRELGRRSLTETSTVGSGESGRSSAPFDGRALAHTAQRDPATNTWRYVGAPSTNRGVREQAGSLLRAFDTAMAAVEKGAAALDAAAAARGAPTDAQEMTATVLGELFSIKSEVAAHFAKRATLEKCVAAATAPDAAEPYLPAPAEVGLSEQTWSRQKEALASIWCEQKWTDLVCSKLADQAGATAVEFGTLLRRLQYRYASMMDRALKLHSDALWQLDAAAASVVARRKAEAETAAEAARREDAAEAERVALRARIDDLERNEANAAAAAKADAEEKLERTRLALDTMKDLFHDLSREKAALGAFDLRDQAERLKAQLAAATEELGGLRLLRDEAATAKAEAKTARVELKAKRRAMQLQAMDLQERGDAVNELMMEKGELLAGIAAAASAKEEASTLAGGDKNEGEVSDVAPPDDVEDFAQSVAKQIEENSILCVRCGRSLDHLEEITKEQANERNKRVRCLGYRMLLPPLPHGTRPALRSHAWAQACMRTILVGKAMHGRLQREESLCSRFPEFVHAWFAKQAVIELTQKERNRLVVMAAQGVKEEEAEVSEDDENRWAFYAKIKELAALGSTEANLFWLLLDETHGSDYLVFFLHCLMAILSVAGPTLHGQLGLTARGLTYRQMAMLAAADDAALYKSDGTVSSVALVKGLDKCVRGTGNVYVYLAQAYATLDAMLVGPLRNRSQVIRAAVRGLAHQCTQSKLSDFDDDRGMPNDDANVWLLFGSAPADTVVPVPKEDRKKRRTTAGVGDDDDAPAAKVVTPQAYCLAAAKEQDKDAVDGLTLAIDLFSFLQVLMHIFKDEQSTRSAAVRVMFAAAAGPKGDFGNLTGDSLSAIEKAQAALTSSNGDLAFAKLPKDLNLDLPKFASVARALWPRCSIVESNGMFREAFELTHGRVDHEVFMKMMEVHRISSRALDLPQFVGVGYRGVLSAELTTQLCTLVSRRYHFAYPMLKRVRAALPEPAAKRFSDSVAALLDMLDGDAPTRGVVALSMYRDLLRRAMALRGLQQDTSDLQQFLLGFDTPKRSTTAIKVESELLHVEAVLRSFDPGDGDESAKRELLPAARARASQHFETVRRSIMARKIVSKWRTKLDAAVGPPPGVLLVMRRGYAQGRGAIHRRRIHKTVDWCHAVLASVYRHVLDDLARASLKRHRPQPFCTSVYQFHLEVWGCATLADRAVHDLFFNVRNMIGTSKRCLLFAAFCGIHGEDTAAFGAKSTCMRLLSDAETRDAALSFFLHAIGVLSGLHSAADKLNNEIVCLYPPTFSDTKGKCESWLVPTDLVAKACAKIFDRETAAAYRKSARERSEDDAAADEDEADEASFTDLDGAKRQLPNVASYDELLAKAAALPTDEVYGEPHVDADGLFWLVMMHWKDLVLDGRARTGVERIAAASGPHDDDDDDERAARDAAKRALLSVDHFSSFCEALGLHGLASHPLDDVSSYQAALTALERCPPPDPLSVAVSACRERHVRSLFGHGAHAVPLSRDNERVRRAINNDWHQYEQIVVNHVNHLDASPPAAGEDGADPDPDAVARALKAANLQKHLKLLQSSLTQIRDVANAAINPDVTTVAAAFGYDDDEYVRAFKKASDAFDTSDEKLQNARLCEVSRVVSRELRCFYAEVYATQVRSFFFFLAISFLDSALPS